jgi:hypothetical protein
MKNACCSTYKARKSEVCGTPELWLLQCEWISREDRLVILQKKKMDSTNK